MRLDKILRRRMSIALALLFAAGVLLPDAGNLARSQSREEITAETIDRWVEDLSNWGRWGKDDQLGAVNLITAQKRRQAARLVKSGVSVSLARDASTEKAVDNPSPYEHEMMQSGVDNPGQFSMDRIGVHYHGWAHTHLDSLCHMFYKGKMYNGFSQREVTSEGAKKLAVTQYKQGVFTRGVLMDIPRLKGVPYLEPGTPIFPEDLQAWEKKAGLRVEPGDVVFIRTGRWARQDEKGPWAIGEKAAGLHASCARWLKDRDIAMLGSDGSSDLKPSGIPGVTHPIHLLVLIAMGAPIFDNCDLEALAAEAAKQKRWAFLLTAAPLPVPGATGSPLNPVATF